MNKNKRKFSANGGDDAGTETNTLIKDERFSKAHYDPIFQNVPKNKVKVKVDSRFNTIFTNNNFGVASSAAVDKRGKRKVRSENELLRYYLSEAAANNSSESASEESESESESSELELEVERTNDTDTDTDDDEFIGDDDDDDSSVEVEDLPVIEKETRRLAVVNMDWSQVEAVDLFVMLSSFLPKRGQIKSVAVYPSDFGIQRMEEEAVRGPFALFENENEDEGDGDEDADEIDNEKFRAYEKSRLRLSNDRDEKYNLYFAKILFSLRLLMLYCVAA